MGPSMSCVDSMNKETNVEVGIYEWGWRGWGFGVRKLGAPRVFDGMSARMLEEPGKAEEGI